jgi:hypothetical protein
LSWIVLWCTAGLGACFDEKGRPPQGPVFGGGFVDGGGYGGSGGGGSAGSGGSVPIGTGDGGTRPACTDTTAAAFTFRWTIELEGGQPSTCEAVGGTQMDLDVLNVDTRVDYHDTFACGAMVATSCPLPVGEYSVALRLRNAQGQVISEALGPRTVSILADRLSDLGPIPFEAPSLTPDQYFHLTWSISKLPSQTPLNCAQAAAAKVVLKAGTMTFEWPCTDGRGRTPTVAAGSHDVSLQLVNGAGSVLSATSTMRVDVTAGKPVGLGLVIFDVL